MQMISAAKLNRIDKILFASRPYLVRMGKLFNNLIKNANIEHNPFFEKRLSVQHSLLCVITSDSGLCASYNTNILRLSEEFIRQKGKDKIRLITIGRKGFSHFKSRGYQIINSYIGFNGRYSHKICSEIAQELIKLFLNNEVDEIYVAYTNFQNALVHKPQIKKFLNLEAEDTVSIQYIAEPSIEEIVERLLPEYILIKLRLMLLEAFTSEHAARTVAMKAATDNAKELLQKLILLRNKVRQAQITQELTEIISSTEALKGH